MRTGRVVDNRTLMATACVPMDLPNGREAVAVIVKATWEIDDAGQPRLPLEPTPVRRAGQPWDPSDPASSLRYPNDVAPIKPGADVLLVGTATPPEGARRMVVSLKVARGDAMLVDKTVTVHGPRVWTKRVVQIVPGDAAPLTPTALAWENTFGGAVRDGETVHFDPRNPVGTGFVLDPAQRVGLPAPSIEDPHAPLTSRTPAPAGFGPLGTSWEPRRSRYGTLDERWRRERSPLMPDDFDPRFFSCAPDDQWVEGHLDGTESVEVLGVRKAGPWRFRLPPGRPRLIARVDGAEEIRRPPLDMLLVDADHGRVELSWRTAFLLPRKSERLETVRVVYEQPLDDRYTDDLAQRHRERRNAS